MSFENGKFQIHTHIQYYSSFERCKSDMRSGRISEAASGSAKIDKNENFRCFHDAGRPITNILKCALPFFDVRNENICHKVDLLRWLTLKHQTAKYDAH